MKERKGIEKLKELNLIIAFFCLKNLRERKRN